MILDKKPLTFAEVKGYTKDLEGTEDLNKYLKKFGKASKEKSAEIIKNIEGLNNPKIRGEGIVKVADFLPKDQEDVNKIFTDANLSEEEANALAEIVKA
jgi:DNA-directed RNA polymerase subunit F